MKLYNTLTKRVEEIQPLSGSEVTIYTCGPTVYDYPHVGNWFTFIRYDLLVRALKLSGYQPKWVMNITDVGHLVSDADDGEDKLEKGARREGKTAWDVAKFYGDYFTEGLQRLNFTEPDYLPKATEHIPEQIELIQVLEATDYVYTIDDGVYYDTSKFPRYADFAQLDIDEQQAGKRVSFNTQKRNPSDFALWKFSPADHKRDMEWDSPWGKGFPGWHLECSAMALKYLGETIDIHSGGIDHVPVHHTNEIAQSEGATGKPLAQYWMHANHVLVEGEKIAKSAGNGITLEDIEAKGISLEAFRLHVLESHYQSQSKFSWDSLQAAQNRLLGYRAAVSQVYRPLLDKPNEKLMFAKSQQIITEQLLADLDTPQVLASLSAEMAWLDSLGIHESQVEALRSFVAFIQAALGINLLVADISSEQKDLIVERDEARTNKEWAKSDELRDQLAAEGIGLRDAATGASWYRTK